MSGLSEEKYAAMLDRIKRNIADLQAEAAASQPGDLVQVLGHLETGSHHFQEGTVTTNPVGWFEIYVEDMARATKFYEEVLLVKLQRLESPDGSELEMMASSLAQTCTKRRIPLATTRLMWC